MDTMTLDSFKSALLEQGRSSRTIAGYLGDLRLFSRWFSQSNGEELSPCRLTPMDVKQYKAYLQSVQKAKPATINRRLAALRIYGAIAVSQRLAEYNPAEGIRGVEEQLLAPKWLGKREQAALVREVERRCQQARTNPARLKAVRDRAIVILMLNTGLRIGELVDLETGDIVITDRKGELTVRDGKGSKARRIPLNSNSRKVLLEWYALRPNGCSQVFTGGAGEGLRRRMVQHMLGELGAAAKLEGVTAHVLRHTFAKNLVDLGISLEKVAALLGHSNLNTTRIYTTPGIQDLERAVSALDD